MQICSAVPQLPVIADADTGAWELTCILTVASLVFVHDILIEKQNFFLLEKCISAPITTSSHFLGLGLCWFMMFILVEGQVCKRTRARAFLAVGGCVSPPLISYAGCSLPAQPFFFLFTFLVS